MKLTFLGSGSAFDVSNYHSNMLLQADSGRNLLIDCGSDARHSLNALGFTHRDIHSVYISHLHADHVGGLEWLCLSTKFDPERKKKPELYINRKLVDLLWTRTLAGGLSSLETEIANLETYLDVKAIEDGGIFVWEGLTFHLVQTIHIMSGFSLVPSFGLLIDIHGKKIFITTDTQFAPAQIKDCYDIADIIFHDCETATSRSEVHANYEDLKMLDEKYKRKMWLYHYNPGILPDAVKDGFMGFVKKGQTFNFT